MYMIASWTLSEGVLSKTLNFYDSYTYTDRQIIYLMKNTFVNTYDGLVKEPPERNYSFAQQDLFANAFEFLSYDTD